MSQAYGYGLLYEIAHPKCLDVVDSRAPKPSLKQLPLPFRSVSIQKLSSSALSLLSSNSTFEELARVEVPSSGPLLPRTHVLLDSNQALQRPSSEEQVIDKGEFSVLNSQEFDASAKVIGEADCVVDANTLSIERYGLALG